MSDNPQLAAWVQQDNRRKPVLRWAAHHRFWGISLRPSQVRWISSARQGNLSLSQSLTCDICTRVFSNKSFTLRFVYKDDQHGTCPTTLDLPLGYSKTSAGNQSSDGPHTIDFSGFPSGLHKSAGSHWPATVVLTRQYDACLPQSGRDAKLSSFIDMPLYSGRIRLIPPCIIV